MFSLLSGAWQYMFEPREYYILILGIDNAGKTVSLPLQPSRHILVVFSSASPFIDLYVRVVGIGGVILKPLPV